MRRGGAVDELEDDNDEYDLSGYDSELRRG